MIELLKLLPKSLTTFLFAVAALLRFFALGSASLVVNLGLEWHAGNRNRRETTAARIRIENENLAARERETRYTRIQNRWIILQIQHQLEGSSDTRAALRDFLVFLSEYGE
jgi:hypothetical protein